MNEKITIFGNSNIYVGSHLLSHLSQFVNFNNYSNVVIISDLIVSKHWLKLLKKNLPNDCQEIIIPNGERAKNIETIQKIWQQMLKAKCDRKSLVINLGGGVIGDMGGFAASTFMRGVDFLNIPTTLLAQVDASIGGKVGFDFAGIKNLIGAFDQPIAVIVDIDVLKTLPKREFLSGFAEIIKHGLITNKTYFEKVSSKHPLKFTGKELVDIIHTSIKIKADIVQSDETETGTRKILNFGHTIGHAIESLSLETQTPLLHGEAIGIGMLTEAKISHALGLISASDLEIIKQSLINADLPTSIPNMKTEAIISKMQSDKKNVCGKINFTLLQKIGRAVTDQNVHNKIIQQALEQPMN